MTGWVVFCVMLRLIFIIAHPLLLFYIQRINHKSRGQRERIQENIKKVKLNKQL